MVIIVVCILISLAALAAVLLIEPHLFMFGFVARVFDKNDEKPRDYKRR